MWQPTIKIVFLQKPIIMNPELLVPIRISWKSGGASKEVIEPRDPSG